jgi:hypothetical protein
MIGNELRKHVHQIHPTLLLTSIGLAERVEVEDHG